MKSKRKTEALSREFHNFVADIENLLNETAALTGDDLVVARSRLHDRVADAKDAVSEMGNDVARRASKSVSRANRKVHDDPWKAIGSAAAVGLLLGLLFSRR
ncbi:MAG: DUF883 family protein [Pseudohongiella sp.]|nr:DUF883 family protein [Pseudohongiella sp.]